MTKPVFSLIICGTLALTAVADEADDWFEHAFAGDETTEADVDLYVQAVDDIDAVGYTYINTINPDAPFKKGKSGIIVAGEPPTARAMQPLSWSNESARRYSNIANLYNRHFEGKVNVYVMPIPLAIAYYCPDEAAAQTSDQHKCIRRVIAGLDPDVTGVDVYPILGMHAAEPIYSRTDHHWAPLGAYYAAMQFADAAGVPFLPLEQYEAVEVPDYVGTMFKFSGVADVKESPETFVYYVPRGVDYETTYQNYTLDKARKHVVSQAEPEQGKFFLSFGGASTYLTFMGGDTKLTKVTTGTKNGRRLLIIKDSFGNAIPGYLFGSFEEIHVVDCRYFTKNMTDYVDRNQITDILFCNNLGHALSPATTDKVKEYLTQPTR